MITRPTLPPWWGDVLPHSFYEPIFGACDRSRTRQRSREQREERGNWYEGVKNDNASIANVVGASHSLNWCVYRLLSGRNLRKPQLSLSRVCLCKQTFIFYNRVIRELWHPKNVKLTLKNIPKKKNLIISLSKYLESPFVSRSRNFLKIRT